MDERDACGLVAIARKDGRPDARVLAMSSDGCARSPIAPAASTARAMAQAY